MAEPSARWPPSSCAKMVATSCSLPAKCCCIVPYYVRPLKFSQRCILKHCFTVEDRSTFKGLIANMVRGMQTVLHRQHALELPRLKVQVLLPTHIIVFHLPVALLRVLRHRFMLWHRLTTVRLMNLEGAMPNNEPQTSGRTLISLRWNLIEFSASYVKSGFNFVKTARIVHTPGCSTVRSAKLDSKSLCFKLSTGSWCLFHFFIAFAGRRRLSRWQIWG